jgi:hypothetical protein
MDEGEPNSTAEDGQTKANLKLAWTIKGMPVDQREVIIRAAHALNQSVADFVWASCDARIRADREPIGLTGQVLPNGANPQVNQGKPEWAELVEAVVALASVQPTPGNNALLGAARAVVRERLRALREPGGRWPPVPRLEQDAE